MAFGVPVGVLVLSLTGRYQASYSPLSNSFFILKTGESHLTCLLRRVKVQRREVTKVFYTPLSPTGMCQLAPGGILAFGGICANDLPCPPPFTGRAWNS